MHITVIAKAPVAGRVKTRLCPPCSPEQAAAIAAAALADTLDSICRVAAITGARPVVLLDGDTPDWLGERVQVIAQRGAGLDQRLANGFTDLGPGVIVGMETPHMGDALAGALRAVSAGMAALALAVDGGYWMIGLPGAEVHRAEALIGGVPMSASHTGLAQLRRLHAAGCAVRLGPMARDLDDIDDLRAVAAAQRPGRLGGLAQEILASCQVGPTGPG